MSSKKAPALSLEFFPARDLAAEQRLVNAARELLVIQPRYVSVTFGAAGSTREGTAHTVSMLQTLGYQAVPHVSCIGSTRNTLRTLLQSYRQQGVRHLVALRGDLPSGMGAVGISDLQYACDLVRFIREEFEDWFHIEVAAYPEMHPQATSPRQDLDHFVTKVNSGANGAITQYFFNIDAYFEFVALAQAKGVTIPIIPGIMPITNYSQLMRFSEMCGAEIPRWIRLRLVELGDDKLSIRALGIEIVTRLCQNLLDQGAPGLHFYTLNQAHATLEIWKGLSF